MRLIDADKLKAFYKHWDSEYSGEELKEYKRIFDSIVDQQPTVDAVKIVRCKDCKYAEWHDNFEANIAQYFCEFIDANVELKDDDFCSKGERREGNEIDRC